MSADAHSPTLAEYVTHHLKNFGTSHQEKIIDFSIINLDTVFWSAFCGVVACLFMYYVARKATSATPNRVQSLVEVLVEMADSQSKAEVPWRSPLYCSFGVDHVRLDFPDERHGLPSC